MKLQNKILRALGHRCTPQAQQVGPGDVTCWCGQRWARVLVAGVGFRWYRAEREARR